MIDIICSTKNKKKLGGFYNNHEGRAWGKSIVVEEPKTREDFFNFAHILFLNFWGSLCQLDGKYVLHEDLSIPMFSLERKKDNKKQIILKWEQRIFTKKP